MNFKEIIKGVLETVKEKLSQAIDKVKLARLNARIRSIQDVGGDTSKMLEGVPTTKSGRISSQGLTNEMLDDLEDKIPTQKQYLKEQSDIVKAQIKEIEFDNDLRDAWEEFINLYKHNEKRAITFTEGSDLYDLASELGRNYHSGMMSLDDLENLKKLVIDMEDKYSQLL